MKIYQWGILGPGGLANKAVKDFCFAKNANVLAVASNTPEKAEKFAGAWGIERVYHNYDDLVCDKDIDIIYITTPNGLHYDNAMLALSHGKHVLVEKPFAMNGQQAKELADYAREKGLFLMEAMWTRFFPGTAKVMEIISAGMIGAVHNIYADFSYDFPYKEGHHLYDLKMGGGTLMDGGVYPLAYTTMIYGELPESTVGIANIEHGVDVRENVILRFPGGEMASFFSGTDTRSFWDCTVYGEKGYIRIPLFHAPRMVEVYSYDNKTCTRYEFDFEGDGYQYQFEEVMKCIEQGLTESPLMPLDETVGILQVIEKLRHEWGVFYPGEKTI